MIKKSILVLILGINLFSKDTTKYKYDCPVPDILMQTIKLTENKSEHPFLIRTNDVNNLEKFERVIKRYEHSYPYKKDKLVIDCHNENNCVTVAIDLINSGITNLDLGLFQINYNSFPENLYTYFNEQYGYRNACKAVISKIKITKDWNWKTLAAYHSLTPHLNLKYRNKLIENYKELLNPKSEKSKSSNLKLDNQKSKNLNARVNPNSKQREQNKKAKIEKEKLYAKNSKQFLKLEKEN